MSRLFSSFWSFIKSIAQKFKDLVNSNKNTLHKIPFIGKVLLYSTVVLFAWTIFSFATHVVVSIIGITVISMFLSKIINLEHLHLGTITSDFSMPLVGFLNFTLATITYFIMPEFAILLAIFVFPQVITDFLTKWREYDASLAEGKALVR